MMKRLFSRTYVTLNISAGDVRAFSVQGGRVKNWGSVPLDPGLVRDGLILQPKAVGEAIHLLFQSRGIPRKRVIVSVTGMSFTYRVVSLPQVESNLLEEAIWRGAKREMPLPVEELYLSWQSIGERDDEEDFFVLGVPRNLVAAVVETLTVAGVKPYIMDLKPLALARAPGKNDAIVVAMEPDCFDIVLAVNGNTEVMHSVTPKGEGATIQDHVRQLADELSRTVKYYNSGNPENQLSVDTPLLLTGQLALDTATSELVQSEMEYPVRPLVPPLDFGPDLPVALYAANMGLALRKTGATNGFHDTQLNILAGTYPTKRIQVSVRHFLTYLALAVIAGLLIPFFQMKSEAAAETVNLQSELDVMNQELFLAEKALISAKADAAEVEAAISELNAVLEALRQEYQAVLTAGGSFAGNLDLVTEILPPLTYFTSIEMNTGTIHVEGTVDNPFTVLSYIDALEAEGFAGVRVVEISEFTDEEELTSIYFAIEVTK
ncbi:MAG: pilus assembly protein PilM [Dehalococcoidales bacterium]|nr:MAG: pilus assembly protein PilM [Dehalococcoidales bacterium]